MDDCRSDLTTSFVSVGEQGQPHHREQQQYYHRLYRRQKEEDRPNRYGDTTSGGSSSSPSSASSSVGDDPPRTTTGRRRRNVVVVGGDNNNNNNKNGANHHRVAEEYPDDDDDDDDDRYYDYYGDHENNRQQQQLSPPHPPSPPPPARTRDDYGAGAAAVAMLSPDAQSLLRFIDNYSLGTASPSSSSSSPLSSSSSTSKGRRRGGGGGGGGERVLGGAANRREVDGYYYNAEDDNAAADVVLDLDLDEQQRDENAAVLVGGGSTATATRRLRETSMRGPKQGRTWNRPPTLFRNRANDSNRNQQCQSGSNDSRRREAGGNGLNLPTKPSNRSGSRRIRKTQTHPPAPVEEEESRVVLLDGEDAPREGGLVGQPPTSIRSVQSAMRGWVEQQQHLLDCRRQQMEDEVRSYRSMLRDKQERIDALAARLERAERQRRDDQRTFYETLRNYVENEQVFRDIIDSQQQKIQQLVLDGRGELQQPIEEIDKADASKKVRVATKPRPLVLIRTAPMEPVEEDVVEEDTPIARNFPAPTQAFFPTTAESNPDLKGTSTTPRDRNCRRRRQVLPTGAEIITFSNGTTKERRPDGSVIIRYSNGDIETTTGTTSAYYFAKSKVTKITVQQPNNGDGGVAASHHYPASIFRYPNGQSERHFRDGRKHILFPNRVMAETVLLPKNGNNDENKCAPTDAVTPRADDDDDASTVSLAVQPPTSVQRFNNWDEEYFL